MIFIKKIFVAIDKLFLKLKYVPYIFPLLIISTLFVLPVPLKYLFNSPAIYTNTVFASEAFKNLPIANNILLILHIAAALPAIIIGPFLFIPKLRSAYTPSGICV